VQAHFRAYASAEEAFEDHARLLATRKHADGTLIYAKAMQHTGDPEAFATALEGIYATQPGYGGMLIGLMRQYNLFQYDILG